MVGSSCLLLGTGLDGAILTELMTTEGTGPNCVTAAALFVKAELMIYQG